MKVPELYTIGRKSLELAPDIADDDPRGLVCIFEPPSPRETYVMGIDPTVGIVGWNRELRTRDDYRTDNGAIVVIAVGRNGKPDRQVAEYAAPIDPEDLADVADCLGRLYAGNDENGECLCIIEVYPGPGLLTQRKMINHLGYSNMFVWKYLDSLAARPTQSLGWQSSPKSVRDLWIRGTRHITKGLITIRSPFLAEELSDCEADQLKMTAKASFGSHDDRARAALMAIWAAHDWSYQVELDTPVTVSEGNQNRNWQSSDISYDKMKEAWEERWDQLSEEYA